MPLTASLDVDVSPDGDPPPDVDKPPDTVTFHFHVRNDGTDPEEVRIRSSKLADIAILDDDEEIWRWSDGQMFAQMMQTETIEPGQTETFEFEWPNPHPGTYQATATLNAMRDISASEQFTV